MPRPKAVPKEDRRTVEISYSFEPYVRVSSDDPKLRGTYGVGKTEREALTNFRSVVRRAYPYNQYDIIEHGDPT